MSLAGYPSTEDLPSEEINGEILWFMKHVYRERERAVHDIVVVPNRLSSFTYLIMQQKFMNANCSLRLLLC